ncbi:MAG: EamA family transporter [Dactylosporangium sp.]|nr:EamA family transporter [Dactylosporangium sp.]
MLVVAAVLAAAVLHASWNAIAKGVEDRLRLFLRSCVVNVALGATTVWWLPLPARESWPWLVGSAGVHIFYNLGLFAAYRLGDFNQTYPLARGVGPLVVTVIAITVIGEPLPVLPAVGVVLIGSAIGVLGLTPWHRLRANRRAVLVAVCTGLTIATYTVLDGVGVRHSGSAVSYAIWLMALEALAAFASLPLLLRRLPAPAATRNAWSAAVATGVLSMLAYGLVLWAQTRGALAAVAALRESSVVVAAALGVMLFREPLGRTRIAASVVVAAGVILLATS